MIYPETLSDQLLQGKIIKNAASHIRKVYG